jgi:hypothetical protein
MNWANLPEHELSEKLYNEAAANYERRKQELMDTIYPCIQKYQAATGFAY